MATTSPNENKPAPDTKEEVKQDRKLAEGTAPIKAEYIDYNHKRVLAEEYLPQEIIDDIKQRAFKDEKKDEDDKSNENGAEPAPKRQKLKGRYKSRPPSKKPEDAAKVCHTILSGKECRFGDKCKFNHDIKKYLESKPADVGDTCYMYTTYGRCPYGVSCRYGSAHIADAKNVVNEKLHSQYINKKFTCNALNKAVQMKLRKRKYDFKKANHVISTVIKAVRAPSDYGGAGADDLLGQDCDTEADPAQPKSESKEADNLQTEDKAEADTTKAGVDGSDKAEKLTAASEVTSEQQDCRVKLESIGISNDDEGIKLRPQEKKKVDFRDKLYLAPLTTVGNLPFRRVCKKYGVDITCGEMAMSTNLLQGKNSEWALLRRHESEDLFGVQLCGSFPDSMARCGQLITEQAEVDFIDINCGCPIDLVFKKGGGCALMSRHHKFEQIVRGMTSVLDVPLTVKMRTGIFEDKSTAHQLIPKLRDWGVSMVTIHGRSREQRYTRMADWEYINLCAEAGKTMPIYGNGDILSFEDSDLIKEKTNVSGLMLARGALIKPWVFTEIKERRHWDISASERFDMLKDFVHFGLEHWGSDTQGVANVRRFLLEWLSFLHRYIPVGLLERLPQKINQKPPYYFGRNDLETMMGSPNCADWVKLSEMLIGPVPEGFTFIPKHKANAYK